MCGGVFVCEVGVGLGGADVRRWEAGLLLIELYCIVKQIFYFMEVADTYSTYDTAILYGNFFPQGWCSGVFISRLYNRGLQ